jgi:hypothetical protein
MANYKKYFVESARNVISDGKERSSCDERLLSSNDLLPCV